MIATRHGSYVVYVHTEESPSDEDWDLALRFYEAADASRLRTLVYTDGAAPNAAQRSRLNTVLGSNKQQPSAVLTPSLLARTAATAIGWFNPNFRVFGPRDFDAAFLHLMATPDERRALRALVEKLMAELEIGPAAAR
jgi:hypothetical protein